MFIDPGLPKGIRLAWRLARSKPTSSAATVEDGGDLDFISALNSTPFTDTAAGRKSGLNRFKISQTRDSDTSLKGGVPSTTSLTWDDMDITGSLDMADVLATDSSSSEISRKEPILSSPEPVRSEPLRVEVVRMEPLSESRTQGRERKQRRERAAKAELEELAHRM
jgi:hypothetical protein